METLSQVGPEELKALFEQLNEATVVAQQQMAVLDRRVVELQEQLVIKDKLLQRKSRLEALGKMAAGVAHEIRNPLGGICLYTDLLIRRLKEGEFSWECEKAMKIRENILALEQIVSDMLNFTQGAALRLHEDRIDEIVREAVQLAKGHKSYKTHHVDLSLASASLCVDKGQLQQVFLNIILNAFQAMEERGELTIRGRFLDQRQSYVLTFCDTGTGIPEDKLDDVFSPFVTFKEGGTGLGLAIGHRVIEQHGGRIEVRNNKVEGVTFIVTLPIEPEGESSGRGEIREKEKIKP